MIEVMNRAAQEKNNLRIRVAPALKDAWDAILARKKISQQDAINSLLELVVMEEDDVVCSMLLGQTRPTPELLAALVKSIGERKPRTRKPDRLAVSSLDHPTPAPRPSPHGK